MEKAKNLAQERWLRHEAPAARMAVTAWPQPSPGMVPMVAVRRVNLLRRFSLSPRMLATAGCRRLAPGEIVRRPKGRVHFSRGFGKSPPPAQTTRLADAVLPMTTRGRGSSCGGGHLASVLSCRRLPLPFCRHAWQLSANKFNIIGIFTIINAKPRALDLLLCTPAQYPWLECRVPMPGGRWACAARGDLQLAN